MKRVLDVYFKKRRVGTLIQDNVTPMKFFYHSTWVEAEDSMRLSWSLPLRREAYFEKECQPFFEGLLPEENNRSVIAKVLGVSKENDFSLLESLGGDCIGAVTFIPEGKPLPSKEEDREHYEPLSEDSVITLLEKELPKRPLLAGKDNIRMSLAGAQNKVSLRLGEDGSVLLPVRSAPSTHIIKPAIHDLPGVVSNERFCLTLAKRIGISAAEVERRKIGQGEYLFVKRYDRTLGKNGQIERLHQEDFCQALRIRSADKYEKSGGPSLRQCVELIRNVSTRPARDVLNFLDIVLFNVLVGNNDAHGKNFSFLYISKDERVLAPAYDILSTTFYKELSKEMAMKIGDRYNPLKLQKEDFRRFAEEVDFSFPLVLERMVGLAEKVEEHLQKIEADLIEADLEEITPISEDISNLVTHLLARARRYKSILTDS